MTTNENSSADLLKSRIDEQANLVRQLKGDSSNKKVFDSNNTDDWSIDFCLLISGRY